MRFTKVTQCTRRAAPGPLFDLRPGLVFLPSLLNVFNGVERRGLFATLVVFQWRSLNPVEDFSIFISAITSVSLIPSPPLVVVSLRALKWLYSKLLMRQESWLGPASPPPPRGPERGFVGRAGVNGQAAGVFGTL